MKSSFQTKRNLFHIRTNLPRFPPHRETEASKTAIRPLKALKMQEID